MKKNGAIKNVPDGYARNYLIPNGLAEMATDKAISAAQENQEQQQKAKDAQATEWAQTAQRISAKPLRIKAKANTEGGLFATITARDIVTTAALQQIKIEYDWVTVPRIKQTGEYIVRITFPNRIRTECIVRVEAQ